MTKIVSDIALLLVGAGFGVISKAVFNPLFSRIERRSERKEKWLEDALQQVADIRKHIQSVRNAVTTLSGFDHDLISKHIIISLTPENTPMSKIFAVRDFSAGKLQQPVRNIEESYRVVRIAAMDIENGAEANSTEEEPSYVIQWYETQLSNFDYELRKMLTAK